MCGTHPKEPLPVTTCILLVSESREASVHIVMGCMREVSCSVRVCSPCVLVSQVSSSQVMSMICEPSWW